MQDRPQPLTDVTAGDWIAPRLGPFGGRVGSLVPRGFAAYARVLHPVPGRPPRRWDDVCAETGAAPHALMQWRAITGGDEERWGHEAGGGSLEPQSLAALCAALTAHSGPQDWYFGVWDGYGWLGGGSRGRFAADGVWVGTPIPLRHTSAGRLHHPHRDYLLFHGPASLAGTLDPELHGQSPSLIWPADRSWCVATEVDLDSTVVGGPAGLVDAVLAAPGLEAWPVGVDDLLAVDADTVNRREG